MYSSHTSSNHITNFNPTNMSQGCPVLMGNNICGEPNSLDIMKDFNRLYKDRMEQVDSEAAEDCLQEKIKLQQEWIRNLTQQNEMLVRAVQELEYEATDRVQQLEEKLQKSAQCLCEVMKKYREHDFAADLLAEPLQKISHLEDDIRNVLEFIRRIRESRKWSLDGLFFYTITAIDLLGTKCEYSNKFADEDSREEKELLQDQEQTIQDVIHCNCGNVKKIADELELRTTECESLKQEMADMRQALTEEVASKHDQLILIKKDIQVFEEQCMQADKQTAFKEDIIRELRKEIKRLKQQVTKKYLNLVAEQLTASFESQNSNSKSSETSNNVSSSKTSDIQELKKCMKIKDDLLVKQISLIKLLVTKLYCVDRGLSYLEERALSITKLSPKGDVIEKDLLRFQNTLNEVKSLIQTTSASVMFLQIKIQKLESENATLKHTLTLDKTYIEQLDEQFKSFLQDRDVLKLKNKMLEKRSKSVLKEKESLICHCKALNVEIQRLKDENKNLQKEVTVTRTELEVLNCESAVCKKNLMEFVDDNRKTTEQVFSLNQENRGLSETIDELRYQSEYITSFTQDEVGKLNHTIEHLKDDLEKTKRAQEEQEQCHQSEISLLNETITSLEAKLKNSEEKDQKVQADLEGNDVQLVKVLNDTKSKMKVEIDKRNSEIRHLKNTINELESALKTCEERATNLHEAVALYSNSINVLEASEEAAKLQMQQQKVTISNLQQALVEAKQEVDEMRKKTQDNDMKRQEILTLLELTVRDMEEENDLIKKQNEKINREHETLQDLNFSLEIEYCDSLQDMDTLENQLKKYRYLFNVNEEQMKNLSKQKRCYEEVIAYFKHEMGLMADQLTNLQELLTLSNESAQQESSKVMQAFIEVQTLNEKLSSQLCACEQKVQLENQLNQLHETKICELQQLLTERELDLSKHDDDVLNIRKTLSDSLRQNEDLQTTIEGLNKTIGTLQCSIKEYEYENCISKKKCAELQNQIGSYCEKLEDLKRSLDEKTEECLKLEIDYNNEKRALKTAQRRLQETKRHQQQNHNDLVDSLEDFKQKLALSEDNSGSLSREWENLLSQLTNLSCKTTVENLETKQNRSDPKLEDICLGCPCVMEFYHKMMDILKRSVTELKKKLSDTQQRNKTLEGEAKIKDSQITDLKKTQEELNQQLSQSSENDKKITDLQYEIDHLTQELQVKSLQMDNVRKSVNEINGSRCVQLACAQEEISNLRSDLANVLEREYTLNRKITDLRAQSDKLHCVVNCLNEKNKMFEDQEDQYLLKIKNLNTEKETLIRKNKELFSELRTIQSMTYSSNKQQRLTTESVKQLEADIEDLKNNKSDICQESKNVIQNVRAWVAEQKRINSVVAKREQQFIQTIKQLNGAIDILSIHQKSSPNQSGRVNRSTSYGQICASPCSLGSQGTASVYDVESPPPSLDFGNNNQWYSHTFQVESENESEDYCCVGALENLTEQMRKSNKIWMEEKRSVRECKDKKQNK